jgi:hypothetical protein
MFLTPHCLEMICEDFLAGASLDNEDAETAVFSMTRFFNSCMENSKRHFLAASAEV